MKNSKLYFLFCLITFQFHLFSQSDYLDNQEKFQIKIGSATGEIQVDGDLSENTWKNADVAKDFWEKWPAVKPGVNPKTEVRMAYDDNFLYVAFTCYDSSNYIIQTLKRDVDFFDSDGVSIVLDPVNGRVNGFLFGISPLGVQSEGLLLPSGGNSISFDWDNKWFSATKTFQDHWTAEMAIPFKTLRYKEGIKEWGINFIRNEKKGNKYHTWAPVPLQFPGVDLGYTGKMIWEESPKKVKGNVSLIPFVTGSYDQDFEEEGNPKDFKPNAGLDAKIAVSSSLNLDVTINPDFSQVEVDEQVTDLTRFSIFFPEKRTFFLENSDLLTDFGIPPARPFFSRTIGLDEDGETVPILFGMRLSGNLNDAWRIAAMNMQTKSQGEQLAQNYSAVGFQRRFWKRSSLRGIFLNRQAMDGSDIAKNDYSRNAGLEFSYSSDDGQWSTWAGYNQSFKPDIDITDNSGYWTAGFFRQGNNLSVLNSLAGIGTNYYADMGFLGRVLHEDATRDTSIRRGYNQSFSFVNYAFYPKKGILNQHEFIWEHYIAFVHDHGLGEHSNEFKWSANFKNSAELDIGVNINTSDVVFPFHFSFTDNPLPAKRYHYTAAGFEYNSDRRKKYNFEASGQYGTFYNGNILTINGGLGLRIQPWGNFNLNAEYNDIDLPDEFGSAQLFLIQSRFEINFTNNLYWTTFVQYNTQAENFNVNSRLQWRFAPMSDFFLVYTDNYLVEEDLQSDKFRISSFGPKNRAIVFKVNYWLTL